MHSQRIVERLKQHQFPHVYQHLNYENAGHVIRYPFIPTTQLGMNGGTPGSNVQASRDSWHHVLGFLRELKVVILLSG